MNYVGSLSILDRGDAPAQAVLDRNARSLAQRVAEETKEDLAKVLERVDNVSKTNDSLKVFIPVRSAHIYIKQARENS